MRSRFLALVLLAAVAAVALLGVARASTDGGGGGPELGPSFERGTLDFTAEFVTSLAFGPDGRLYVATLSEITALTLDSTGTHVEDTEVIAADLSYVLGLAFDPTATAEPITVYASRLDLEADAGLGGTISTFTAPDWTQEDVITGLPDWQKPQHFTNGIAFDQGGTLFIAQGISRYDMPLSGAVLRADIHASAFDGHMTYRPSGPIENSNAAVVSGDVRVISSGLRNPYDLVLHSNGKVYATDNGGVGPDELNLIEEGNYYGHPNLNRGKQDPRQLTFYSGDEPGNDEYSAPILTECRLCQGFAEYTNDAFDGSMQGDLILASLSGEVWRVELSPDGRQVDRASVLGEAGGIDVVVGPMGVIYAGTSYLEPMESAPKTPPPSSGDADCDGVTDSKDATIVLHLTALLIGNVPCPAAADVDGNRLIDSLDALLILQCSAGLWGC